MEDLVRVLHNASKKADALEKELDCALIHATPEQQVMIQREIAAAQAAWARITGLVDKFRWQLG